MSYQSEKQGLTITVPYGPDRSQSIEQYREWLEDIWMLIHRHAELEMLDMVEDGFKPSREWLERDFTERQNLIRQKWGQPDT